MNFNDFLLGGGLVILVTGVSELFSWVTKKLTGSPLQSLSAWIVTAALSLAGGLGYLAYTQIPTDLMQEAIKIGAVVMLGAELVFQILIKNVPALHVTEDPSVG